MRRILGCALALCLGVLALGCEPAPSATVLLIGDSNWPSPYLAAANHYGEDHAPLTLIEDWPGLGLVKPQSTYPAGFAVARISAAEARVHPDYVVTNLGVNDVPADPASYPAAIDGVLTAAGTARVIWIAPVLAGPDQPGVEALDAMLDSAASTHPELWVVHLDAVLDAVGGCPTAVAGTVVLAPRASCYLDRATNVHLSTAGRFVLALLTRLVLGAAVGGNFGASDATLAQALIDALA